MGNNASGTPEREYSSVVGNTIRNNQALGAGAPDLDAIVEVTALPAMGDMFPIAPHINASPH